MAGDRNARRRLLRYLRRGLAVTRETYGPQGALVRWVDAARTGRTFDPQAASRLLLNGCKIGGKRHELRLVPGASFTFRLEPCEQ